MYIIKSNSGERRLRKLYKIAEIKGSIIICPPENAEDLEDIIKEQSENEVKMIKPVIFIDEDAELTRAFMENHKMRTRNTSYLKGFVILDIKKFKPSHIPDEVRIDAIGMQFMREE